MYHVHYRFRPVVALALVVFLGQGSVLANLGEPCTHTTTVGPGIDPRSRCTTDADCQYFEDMVCESAMWAARIGADEKCRGVVNCGCSITSVGCDSKDHACNSVPGQSYSQCAAVATATATGTCQPNIPKPSSVPGRILPTIALRILTAGALEITWMPDACNSARDYAIYEGTIGNWYSHRMLDCHDDNSDFRETVPVSSGNKYYLVVPLNPGVEGSYGQDSSAHEIPKAALACMSGYQLDCPVCDAASFGAPCDDGDACTTNDFCNGSSCRSGQSRNCDDSNPCTVDSCDPVVGCISTRIPSCP